MNTLLFFTHSNSSAVKSARPAGRDDEESESICMQKINWYNIG